MTIRAKKHAIMTEIAQFEKRDRRTHPGDRISPYHTSRRAKNRRDGRDGWHRPNDSVWWYTVKSKIIGKVVYSKASQEWRSYCRCSAIGIFPTRAKAQRWVERKVEEEA